MDLTTLEEPLGGLKSVQVKLAFGAGELVLTALPSGAPNLVVGQLLTPERRVNSSLRRSGSAGTLVVTMGEEPELTPTSEAIWNIALSRSPQLKLDVTVGASNVHADIRDLQVTQLLLDAGASDILIALPENAGRTAVSVSGSASNVDVIVPKAVAARIKVAGELLVFMLIRRGSHE